MKPIAHTRPPMRVPYPQTRESAGRYIKRHGMNVAAMARYHGLPRDALAHLLAGTLKGTRGDAHLGAIVLGLKPDPREHAA